MHGKITDGDFENVVDAPFGVEPKLQMLSSGVLVLSTGRPVLRVFPPCALLSHAQGSSGVVDNMPFAWRGHTKSLTTRARPSPDRAMWLE